MILKSKLTILFSWLLILMQTNAISQSYKPFPTSDARWYIELTFFGCGYPICYEYYEYVIIGDTLISLNNKVYSKLYGYYEINWEEE